MAGTYYYSASVTERELDRDWLDSQLAGALMVDPPHGATNDRIFVISGWRHLEDSSLAVPKDAARCLDDQRPVMAAHQRLGYTQGDSVRWRWINASVINHAMHLHGFYYRMRAGVTGDQDGRIGVRSVR